MPRWHLLLFSLLLIIVSSSAQISSKSESSSKSSSSSDSDSASQNSTCYLPNCRKCDILDLESCTCIPVFVKCAKGYTFDEETCNCIESSSEPSICPNLECPEGQHINEARCECTDKICQTFVPCPSNTILDLETCKCICNLDPNLCPDYYIFDEFNCICRHPVCDPPGPCPGNSFWDTELCQCNCTQKSCEDKQVFDVAACECISINSTEPETKFPSESNSNCEAPSPCPGLSSWNYQTCSCICAVKVKCFADYIFNNETCQCENPFGSSSYQVISSSLLSSTESSSLSPNEPSSSCYIPDCKRCDFFDPEECYCYPIYIACLEGYWLDDEGCSCVPIPGYSPYSEYSYPDYSESPSPPSSPSPSECERTVPCSDRAVLNPDICECQCIEYIDCIPNYRFDPNSCECVPIDESSTVPSIFSHSVYSSCSIPDCRWCDWLDLANCQCYRRVFECMVNYRVSNDGCSCVPIEGASFSDESSYSQEVSSSCEQYASCPDKTAWNRDTCECQCIENILCIQNYTFNAETCECEPEFEGPTNPSMFSQSLISSCSIPDCRWCDYLDVLSCECYRIAIDCLIGYELSSDGCSCVPISGFSYPSSDKVSSDTESNSSPIPSFPCMPASSCPDKHFWNQESCSCECVEQIECSSNYELSLRTCQCEPVSAGSSESHESSLSSETSMEPCSIPSCRWCDDLDYENCICHRTEFECMEGYQKSRDGCSCFFISTGGLTDPPSVHSSSPCFIESCRWCDKINIDNCTCQRTYVDCALGFELSSDGCSCVKSSSTSANCPGIYCGNGTYIDESTCKCLSGNSSISSESLVSSLSSNLTSSSSCSLPFCRSCDVLDTENCVCHQIVIDCSEGYKLSEDGCNCEWVGLPSNSESSTEQFSSSSDDCGSNPPPYCRWCDHYDAESCICHMRYVDCGWGYELSPDGCTCLKSNVTSESSDSSYRSPSSSSKTPSPSSSPSPSDSTSCLIPDCGPCDILDTINCVCHKKRFSCSILSVNKDFELNEDTCRCEYIGPPIPSEYSTGSDASSISSINICSVIPHRPGCDRPCDDYDEDNCICHMIDLNCALGYEESPHECSCIESNATSANCPDVYCDTGSFINKTTCECILYPSESSSSESYSSESSSLSGYSSFESSSFPIDCSLPDCRSCDVLDIENCICHKRVVDCFQGYELSEDGCECVKSHSTSENCPGIYCSKGTYIDEIRCQCLNDSCRYVDACPGNLLMDANTCECYCNLNPSDCSFPYTFDHVNCKCRHPPCDPPGPCPNKLSWDPENCKCRCIQNKACDVNFIFDSDSCDCVCDPKMMNTTCPSGSVFDSLLCDCIEEIDCYDLSDPACACECEEVLDCPPGKEFDLDYCDCLCPYYEVDPCPEGFMTSEETCECVKQYP